MRKAFVVGINDYPRSGLDGCINDCRLVYKMLDDIYKFDKIKMLTDANATKGNIITELKNLVRGVQPGDTVYFHFSGHGTRVAVDDVSLSEEVDGFDECIVPVDHRWESPLRDHYVGNMFKLIPAGVTVLVVLDMCHSGTGLRNPAVTYFEDEGGAMKPVLNRFLPPPTESVLSAPDMTVDWGTLMLTKNGGNRGIVYNRPFIIETVEQGDAILISGCEEGQTSADAWINGRYHGALTFYMVQTLMENDWKLPYNKLIEKVNSKTDQYDYDQNPQLEGKPSLLDDLFLGGV